VYQLDVTFEDVKEQKLEERAPVGDEKQYDFAGFWMRFWAYLLDLIVIGSINGIIVNPIFLLFDLSKTSFIFSPNQIIGAVIFFSYFVLMTKYFGQTLGKMVFGLRVISLNRETLTWSDVLFRELIGRYISKKIWIGYVIVAFTRKKQGLHDLFTDTTVIHEGR
jgi:uncharacterized RDD family membrane protein YckC